MVHRSAVLVSPVSLLERQHLGSYPRLVCMGAQWLSHVQLFATPWTAAHQAPLSMGFPREEYWSELPCSPPRDLPNPGTEPESPESPVLAGRFFTTEPPGKPSLHVTLFKFQTTRLENLLARFIYLLWDTDSGQQGLFPQRQCSPLVSIFVC